MKSLSCLFIVLFVLSFASCSSSQITIPSRPSDETNISSLPVWVSDSSSGKLEGMGVMGLFAVSVDTANLRGEIVSLRSGTLTDVLEVVDITNFLQLAPCTDCVILKSIALNPDGNLVLTVGIKHPFPAGDPLKPITGRNRADLHVFNVEGIVISDGSSTLSFPGLGKKTGNFRLLNADGYTGYLDASIDTIHLTEADIHPFITHFADYAQGNYDPSFPTGFQSVVEPPPSGNLVIPMGSDYDLRDYTFDLTDGAIDFTFAVGCTYAVSAATKTLRFSPEYRVPQHNKKAASHVNVVIQQNDLKALDTNSEAQLIIEVLDINHGVAVGEALNEMKADSSVSTIKVEVPGITSTPVSFSTTPTGGDGRDPGNPLTFAGTIQNSAGGDEGMYSGIVKVTDSYPCGLNESPLLNGMDGIKRVEPIQNPLEGLFAISEFATYQLFEIYVELGNENPVAILKPDPANGCNGATIWFDGSDSYDPDGTIVLYEFDWTYDGSNFTVDASGTTARVQSSPYAMGTYTAALRVTDNLSAQSIDTVPVNINAVDGFDVSPYTVNYVTDTSFSNIIFAPNAFLPREWNGLLRPFGMEAMATGSEYIYAVYYATGPSGNGIYLARSGDDGATWGGYQLIHSLAGSSNFRGAAICAVGKEVFITTLNHTIPEYYIYYNDNNGEGAFTQQRILDSSSGLPSIGEPSIAVDPDNTDNIYACFAHYLTTTTSVSNRAYVLTSHSGPSGTFTLSEALYTKWLPDPYNYYDQAWSTEIKIAPDGDIYVIQVQNGSISTHKSVDDGVTWNRVSDTSIYTFSRHADYCFDPDNAETIYLLVNRRYYNTYQYFRSTNGGASWSFINTNFQVGSDTAYSNPAICTDLLGNIYAVITDVTPGNADVYGRYSTNDGSSFGVAFPISTHTGNDAEVEITPTTNGCDVVIGWLEDRDGTPRVVSRRG